MNPLPNELAESVPLAHASGATAKSDVLIVGGGVIGAFIAYYLARDGRDVVLLEERETVCPETACSYANMGMIVPSEIYSLAKPGAVRHSLPMLIDRSSPFYIQPRLERSLARWLWLFGKACRPAALMKTRPFVRSLGVASAELFEDLAGEGRGDAFGYRKAGWTVVYADRKAFASAAGALDTARSLGVSIDVLGSEQLVADLPGLGPFVAGGLHESENAAVEPSSLVRWVVQEAARAGARVHLSSKVVGFDVTDRRVSRVRTGRGVFSADTVVLAAGIWTAGLARMLGMELPLEAARGYSVDLPLPEDFSDTPVYLGEEYVGAVRVGNRLRLAGTLELTRLGSPVSRPRMDGLSRSAQRYFPALRGVEPIAEWEGYRPVTPDGLPILGWSPKHDNVMLAGGHCMLGVSLGPITGLLVRELLAGEEPSVNVSSLAPTRFLS